ncbi:multicopper oxidase domain-containing protein [Paenibacillus sp. A3]|uniref:multicopper oxidase domain-containing protein n=1 Tax=Paenibacillus sp. A3 TaxID=1337054 RepID=UPI000A42A4FD|nr:multicopper oxidase domain-containing protein [Paenibacillus sp. A3]
MFETFASIVLASALTLLWGIAAFIVSGLPYAKNNRRFKRWTTVLLWIGYIALAIAALWLFLVLGWYIRKGWLFVEGTMKAIVPLMLIGHLPVVTHTLPKLRSLRESTDERLAAATLVELTHPMAIIPIYAAAVVSGMNAFSHVFAQPVLPTLAELVQRLFLLVVLLLVPTFFAMKTYRKVMREQFVPSPLWARLLKFGLAGGLTAVVVITVVVVNVLAGVSSSKLPEASDMVNHHLMDEGGGAPTLLSGHAMHRNHSNRVEVAALTGDVSAPADIKFELVAQQKEITLASGAIIDAWTYNGQLAPELRVRQGDMVEVKLVNQDIDKGVTIHWHGYNVPNAMDGVPGMTQNVVKPGQSFTYKFRAKQAGTYWFHSHQQAAEQVIRGLFGTLIVDPKNETEVYDEEFTVVTHRWDTDRGYKIAFGDQDQAQTKQVATGQKIKLRIVNTHNLSQKYVLHGVDYQIASIDGVDIQEPERLPDSTAFRLASGGRYDIAFTMPDHPVLFKLGEGKKDGKPSLLFYTDTRSQPESLSFESESAWFDPSQYGKAAANETTSATKFDREFTMILGNKMGF